MNQSIKQVLYCGENSAKNSVGVTAASLISGAAFAGYTIVQLGIQAPPGTKFYINNNSNPNIVGFTGLYEINLTSGGSITSLSFDEKSINWIKQHNNLILIVDMAYLGGGN